MLEWTSVALKATSQMSQVVEFMQKIMLYTVSINGYSGFINNSAKEFGGGLYVIDASRINISGNSCFTGNSAKLGGGGMYVVKNSIVSFSGDSLLSENWSQYGGCFSIRQSEIVFQGNMTISTNNATYGGAIQAIEAIINITGNCNFSKNLATLNGTSQNVSVSKSFQSWILHSFQVVYKLGNEPKCPSGVQACSPPFIRDSTLGHFSSFPSLCTTWKL